MTAVTADWVVDGQDYYIEIADNVQLSVASTCQLSGSAGSVVTWRSDLIGWFDAPAHAFGFGSFQVAAIRTGGHPAGGWLVLAFCTVVP